MDRPGAGRVRQRHDDPGRRPDRRFPWRDLDPAALGSGRPEGWGGDWSQQRAAIVVSGQYYLGLFRRLLVALARAVADFGTGPHLAGPTRHAHNNRPSALSP